MNSHDREAVKENSMEKRFFSLRRLRSPVRRPTPLVVLIDHAQGTGGTCIRSTSPARLVTRRII
jgi:2-phosphoglycerate kinase